MILVVARILDGDSPAGGFPAFSRLGKSYGLWDFLVSFLAVDLSHWKTFHMLLKHGARELNLLYDSSPVNVFGGCWDRQPHSLQMVREVGSRNLDLVARGRPFHLEINSRMARIVTTAED